MKPCQTDKDGLLRIEDQLCFALYSTSRAITKVYGDLLADMGLTYPQYLALMVLWHKDGLLIQEIAKNLELEGATTTPLIQRLEKLGLVIRQRSQEDERKVQVYLTQQGKDLYQQALSVPEGFGCATGLTYERAVELMKKVNEIKIFINDSKA